MIGMQWMRKRRERRADLLLEHLKENLEEAAVEGLLVVLLNVMSLLFLLDKGYRRNIAGFKGRYNFCSADKGISASCAFTGRRMKVSGALLRNPNVTVCFRDEEAVLSFLTGGDPDILNFMLENKLSYQGNLNYLMKFAYMSIHLVRCFVRE